VPATATAARATPAHVTQQIAVSVSVARGGETEVRLNPEDLGRVRLALSGAEGTLTVTISAERPETADLLRRHIDSLAREFAALGYGDVGFHFEGESREDRAQDRPGGQGGSAPDPAPTEETDLKPPRRTLVIGGGLDLKL
jgi:flagellar hook-length control protein FliK